MNQRIKDLWVIPGIVSVITGLILGTLFMVWGASYSGAPLHSPVPLGWFGGVFSAKVPAWSVGVALFILSLTVGMYFKQVERVRLANSHAAAQQATLKRCSESMQDMQARHVEELNRLRAPEPVLHASWSRDSWWTVEQGKREKMVCIGGTVTLQIDNIRETVTIVGVRIEGAELVSEFENFQIRQGVPAERWLSLSFRGLEATPGEPLSVVIQFEDLKGRAFTTRPATFRSNH